MGAFLFLARKEMIKVALTAKQKKFVEEYLIDLNATQAAIRAGYSPDTAYSVGSENLKKPEIKASIDKAMAERSRRTGISQDRVIQELARIAFVNPQKVIQTSNASVRQDISEDDAACIQAVKVKMSESENGSSCEREVRLNDKLKALELLGKHLGMFTDKAQIEIAVPIFEGENDLED